MLNNEKDDLEKISPKCDGGIFVSYWSSNKAYRIYNQRNIYVEESIQVILDELGNLSNLKDEDASEIEELVQTQRNSLDKEKIIDQVKKDNENNITEEAKVLVP